MIALNLGSDEAAEQLDEFLFPLFKDHMVDERKSIFIVRQNLRAAKDNLARWKFLFYQLGDGETELMIPDANRKGCDGWVVVCGEDLLRRVADEEEWHELEGVVQGREGLRVALQHAGDKRQIHRLIHRQIELVKVDLLLHGNLRLTDQRAPASL